MIEINIDENLIDSLNKVAALDNVTPALWIERKINALLLSKRKEALIDEIKNQRIETIADYETAFVATKEAITLREAPIVEEIINTEVPTKEGTSTEPII